jgi:hypothetical protein
LASMQTASFLDLALVAMLLSKLQLTRRGDRMTHAAWEETLLNLPG